MGEEDKKSYDVENKSLLRKVESTFVRNMVRFQCPKCEKIYFLPLSYCNKEFICKRCDNSFLLLDPNIKQCPSCKNLISKIMQDCQYCGNHFQEDTELKPVNLNDRICPNPDCEYYGEPEKVDTDVHGIIAFVLFLLFLPAGLVYYWIMCRDRYRCPHCKSEIN